MALGKPPLQVLALQERQGLFLLSPVTRMEGTQRTAKEKLLYSRKKDFLCLPK